MTTRSKVYCSSCGGGNSAEEKFCSTCGSTMGMVNAPAAPTTTVVREGVVATGVQHVGYTGASIVAILTLLVTIFGLAMPLLGYWLYRREEDVARRKGSLSEY